MMESAVGLVIVIPGFIIALALSSFFCKKLGCASQLAIIFLGGCLISYVIALIGGYSNRHSGERSEAYFLKEVVFFKSALSGAYSEFRVKNHYRSNPEAMYALEWNSHRLLYDVTGCIPTHQRVKSEARMIMLLASLSKGHAVLGQLAALPEAPFILKLKVASKNDTAKKYMQIYDERYPEVLHALSTHNVILDKERELGDKLLGTK